MPDLTLTGLDGKVAIVTGAGRMRSIGRPIAVELARAGCDIVITGTGRHPDRYPDDEKAAGWRDIDSVADEVRALGRRALPVVSNVADADAVDTLVEQVMGELGRVDILVNNAGAARGSDRVPVVDLAVDDWRTVIDVNLNGTFYMSRAFGRHMVDRGEGGSIVNISSIAGKMMGANTAAYSASKAGIHALTSAMAQELGRCHGARQRDLPGPHRHLSHGRHPRGRGVGRHGEPHRAARARRHRRRHRVDGPLPLLRPGVLDHRPALQRRRRDAHRPLNPVSRAPSPASEIGQERRACRLRDPFLSSRSL